MMTVTPHEYMTTQEQCLEAHSQREPLQQLFNKLHKHGVRLPTYEEMGRLGVATILSKNLLDSLSEPERAVYFQIICGMSYLAQLVVVRERM